jgi:tetratricopeptide (TPR) repeat protein
MTRLRDWARINLLLTLVMVVATVFTPPATAAFKHLAEGMDAPEVSGQDVLTGEAVSSSALLQENLVIVVFWATWSPRSLAQLQDLGEIATEYAGNPVSVIAVNVDAPGLSAADSDKITGLVRDLDLPFPVIIDEGLKIFYRYGVIAVPSTAVIDSSGTLKYGPSSYSLTTKDRIVDSIRVFLGLVDASQVDIAPVGYRPDKRAGRFFGLAVQLSEQRLYEQALSNLDSAIVIDTAFAAPHMLRGEIRIKTGHADSAIAGYQRAIGLDSQLVQAWAGLGEAYVAAGDYESALAAVSRARTMDDTYTPALLVLGHCLTELGRTDDALDSLVMARELNVANPAVHYYIGCAQRKSGNSRPAAESFLAAGALLFPEE